MKRLLIILLAVMAFFTDGMAQKVSYYHKQRTDESCRVNYFAQARQDGLYIIVIVQSTNLTFMEAPDLMLRNFDGEVRTFPGRELYSMMEISTTNLGDRTDTYSKIRAAAQFKVGEEDIPFFKSGIKKVRLSTLPFTHERVFERDLIGTWLADRLTLVASTAEDF